MDGDFLIIYTGGQAFIAIPNKVLRADTVESVEAYYKDFLEGGAVEWREMKILVLGHGRIGKTHLVTAIENIQTNEVPIIHNLIFCRKLSQSDNIINHKKKHDDSIVFVFKL